MISVVLFHHIKSGNFHQKTPFSFPVVCFGDVEELRRSKLLRSQRSFRFTEETFPCGMKSHEEEEEKGGITEEETLSLK